LKLLASGRTTILVTRNAIRASGLRLLLTSKDGSLARRHPALVPELRRNVRWTVPILFFGFCLLLLLLLAAGRAVRIV
jgi:hypothetical protein